MKEKCLIKTCTRPAKNGGRGLCNACYHSALRLVRQGIVTWEELVNIKLASNATIAPLGVFQQALQEEMPHLKIHPTQNRLVKSTAAVASGILTTGEAAALLNCSQHRIIRLVDMGQLPATKSSTGYRRIQLIDLCAYAQCHNLPLVGVDYNGQPVEST